MQKVAESLNWVAVTLWVGGLWTVGYLVAPLLFAHAPDRQLAGILAGHMFAWISYVGIFCGAYLIVYRLYADGSGALKQGFFWIAVLMLVLTFAGHFGVAPIMEHLKSEALPRDVMESVFKGRFRAWHGVSSVLYLIQSLSGLALLLAQRKSLR